MTALITIPHETTIKVCPSECMFSYGSVHIVLSVMLPFLYSVEENCLVAVARAGIEVGLN